MSADDMIPYVAGLQTSVVLFVHDSDDKMRNNIDMILAVRIPALAGDIKQFKQ